MRRATLGTTAWAVLLVGLGMPTAHALEHNAEAVAQLEVTDLAASTMPAPDEDAVGETASVGYAARYTLTEDLAEVNGTASLPTAWIPPDRPELDGLPSPASGEFVIWSSSPDTATWAPQVRQVGGLYLAPQLTPAEGTPPPVDAAQAGDRVDFGVTHYALDMRYPDQESKPGGVPSWELTAPQTMFLRAHSGGADGGVGFGSRVAYLHAKGGDLDASATIPDIEVPLPPGTWEQTLMNWQAGIITPAGGQLALSSSYDAVRHTMVFHPTLTGTLPESSAPVGGPRNNVIGVVLFAYARPDASTPPLGTLSSLTVPLGGQGVLASAAVGEDTSLTIPIGGGERSELALGAGATPGDPHLFGRRATAPSSFDGEEVATGPGVSVLDEVVGVHETTGGLVRYEVDPNYRGVPAITDATLTGSGQALFDGIAAPILGNDRPLRASDLVDARVFPAAWAARFSFAGGWVPVLGHVYYDGNPMPYTVATSTAYTVGSTVDLVYKTGEQEFVHLEMSMIEPQEATGDRAIVDGVAEYLGSVGTGEEAPSTPVVVSLRPVGAGLSPGTRAATVPLSHEAEVPAGTYQPVAFPAGVGRGPLLPLYLDFTGGGPARSVFAQDALGELVLTNAASSLPGPASPATPPVALNPAGGLDVLVTSGNAVLLQF